ncbi:unnamed protein product [Closterium sp. Yama58-4]|nr:unnamed protein product [Closterium sp. Yama58-4]
MVEHRMSLVFNVKRSLLERVARCTGAKVAQSAETLDRLGQCQRFWTRKFVEEWDAVGSGGGGVGAEGGVAGGRGRGSGMGVSGVGSGAGGSGGGSIAAAGGGRKNVKTLLFLEGCPIPLGCTVLLMGAPTAELKRVKRVMHFAPHLAHPLAPVSPSEHQSILVWASSRCVSRKLLCEPPELMRIKYYGDRDMPLGHFLTQFVLNPLWRCKCGMPSQDHVRVYSHKEGSLTISVRKADDILPPTHPLQLPGGGGASGGRGAYGGSGGGYGGAGVSAGTGEGDMVCAPATRRVLMSEAACKLSLGKFLELSFTNHVVVGRLAACGHSLHRDCLRFYRVDGVAPATRRVLMSEVACKLSLGKFLELSFTNHVVVGRLAACGHSLHRDCLRFYRWVPWKMHGVDGVAPATRRVLMSEAACKLSLGKFLELSFTNHVVVGRLAACGHSLHRDCLRFYRRFRVGLRRLEVVAFEEDAECHGVGKGHGRWRRVQVAGCGLNVKSYANNNQMAIMPDERVQVLEWNRRYLIVLAVANRRLYQLRLQVPERLLDAERPVLRQVMDSFRVFSVAE